ncbi:hypothetical protein ATOBIA_N01310 [Atopobiaceae bacterium P1]|nr:hypothetical protein ATOBIA_N01310 [Atopobiaceae bacterium P1]
MSALLESEFELLPQAPSERTSREAQATAPSFVARVIARSLPMGRSAAFDEVTPSLLGKFQSSCILGRGPGGCISWVLMKTLMADGRVREFLGSKERKLS